MTQIKIISRLNEATIDIVSAYIARHHVSHADLPILIKSVQTGLASLERTPEQATEPRKPAVPVTRSVFRDYIVCLEDGRSFKTLKRHLRTAYGLTPDQYRARWGLPHDYPVVAPGYAASRAVMARENGLGKRHRAPVA